MISEELNHQQANCIPAFSYLHSELQEKQPGTSSPRNSAKVAVENVKRWWLYKAGIPTKFNNTLIDMILKIHKN